MTSFLKFPKSSTFFFLLLLAILMNQIFINCRMDFTDNKFEVVNNSDLHLGILVNYNYPDTAITNTRKNAVYPNSSGAVLLINRYWEDVFKEVDRITLFLVDWKEVERYGTNHEEKYAILKRMSLTKADLDSLRWIIKYP